MKITNEKKLTAFILIATVILGGCANNATRQTAAESDHDSIKGLEMAQNKSLSGLSDQYLDDSMGTADPMFPKSSDQSWLQPLEQPEDSTFTPPSEEDGSSQPNDNDNTAADTDDADSQSDDEDSDLWARIRQNFALPDQHMGKQSLRGNLADTDDLVEIDRCRAFEDLPLRFELFQQITAPAQGFVGALCVHDACEVAVVWFGLKDVK